MPAVAAGCEGCLQRMHCCYIARVHAWAAMYAHAVLFHHVSSVNTEVGTCQCHAVLSWSVQVIVDPADEAFKKPTKQVGPHYSQQVSRGGCRKTAALSRFGQVLTLKHVTVQSRYPARAGPSAPLLGC